MLILCCPFCGNRNESEFSYGGTARAKRSDAAVAANDAEWVEYLTVTDNPKGPVREKWWHKLGCGTWMIVERDTVTHRITKTAAGGHDER